MKIRFKGVYYSNFFYHFKQNKEELKNYSSYALNGILEKELEYYKINFNTSYLDRYFSVLEELNKRLKETPT